MRPGTKLGHYRKEEIMDSVFTGIEMDVLMETIVNSRMKNRPNAVTRTDVIEKRAASFSISRPQTVF